MLNITKRMCGTLFVIIYFIYIFTLLQLINKIKKRAGIGRTGTLLGLVNI